MNKWILIILMSWAFQTYSQELTAVAYSYHTKRVAIDASATVDGDLATVWSVSMDKKLDLFVSLKKAIKIRSLSIIWEDDLDKSLSLTSRFKGVSKNCSVIVHDEEKLVTFCDFSDLDLNLKWFQLSFKNDGPPKKLSIREIKINDEKNGGIVQQQKTEKQIPESETEKQIPEAGTLNEAKESKDEGASKDNNEELIKVKKSNKTISI